jgi:hypothetical protein
MGRLTVMTNQAFRALKCQSSNWVKDTLTKQSILSLKCQNEIHGFLLGQRWEPVAVLVAHRATYLSLIATTNSRELCTYTAGTIPYSDNK